MPRTRKFDGKTYQLDGSYRFKPEAQERAYILRKTGYHVRVVKAEGKKGVWHRGARGIYYARDKKWQVWRRKKA